MSSVSNFKRGGRNCILGCSGDVGLVGGVWRLLYCEVRGSYACPGWGVVVKVVGWIGGFWGTKDRGRSDRYRVEGLMPGVIELERVSGGILLGFYYKLSFFIIHS